MKQDTDLFKTILVPVDFSPCSDEAFRVACQVARLVMGSYGARSGSVDKIFFGSTAEKVVRTAGCPVLTVPLATSASQHKAMR